MKLMLCPDCADIKSLRTRYRTCVCGHSSARVEEDLNTVIYRGQAIILAMKDADVAQIPSNESPIVYNVFKQKETYRTMHEKATPLMIAEMGHKPHG